MSADLPRCVAERTLRTPAEPLRRRFATRRLRRPHLLLVIRLALFAVAAVVLHRRLAGVNGTHLMAALRSYGWQRVALGLGCTAASFLTLGLIELTALRYADGHTTRPVPRAAAITTSFVAHAFSQSAGFGLLTGAAVRLRAYTGYGVTPVTVARVSAFVTVTTLLGICSLGAVALLAAPPALAGVQLGLGERPVGVLLAAAATAYLFWSMFGADGGLAVGRWRVPRPSLRLVATQLLLSAVDWIVTGSVLFLLLPAGFPLSFPELVRVFLVAQAVGMASHVPGGAGVFEAAIVVQVAPAASAAMLGGLAASLVAYRLVYYLVPLVTAAAVAAIAEVRRPRAAAPAAIRQSVRRPATPPRSPRAAGGGGAPLRLHTGRGTPSPAPVDDQIEWLIDNADAYDRLLDTIRTARRSVWITQLAFDADCIVYGRDAGQETTHRPPRGETMLAETLLALVAGRPVDVRILLNATFLLDTARPLRRFFARRLRAGGPIAGRIRVRGVRRFPNFLHVKMVIVDGAHAFVLGSPFVNSYWDTARHHPVDARRPMRELGGRPLHDVSFRIAGGAVQALESHFAELWNGAATAHANVAPLGHGPWASPAAARAHGAHRDSPRVLRTLPRRVLPHAPYGTTEVLDALLEGIDRARSLIYIEHQYLTARPVVAALVQALWRQRDLELVIVLNQNPDLTAYWGWQNARIAESGLLEHPRAGLFTLWSAASSPDRPEATALNQVFVHSKVVTVDDTWAMAGAANLDGLSLHSYGDDFTGRAARRIFRHVRNFEVGIEVRDRVDRTAEPGSVAELRARLWSEHLGMPADSLTFRPPGGWLRLWRARARFNVEALGAGADRAGTRPHMRGFVLPYSMRLTPRQQLRDLGVRIDPARLDVRYDPGWLQTRLSASWVRNMFA